MKEKSCDGRKNVNYKLENVVVLIRKNEEQMMIRTDKDLEE